MMTKNKKYTLKELGNILKCLIDIDSFSLTTKTQKKLVEQLIESKRFNNKMVREKKEEKNTQFQSVILFFNNGKKAIFSGPAVLFGNEDIIIEDIKFTKPKELPSGTEFISMKD